MSVAQKKPRLKMVSTKGMDRPEWLNRRRKSIGGSEAAGLVGLTKWSSPYSIWCDKMGLLPEVEDNEAMRLGRDLEDYVARRWASEQGKRVKRVNAMLYHPEYPFAHADIDRWVVGENAGLECKTTSSLDMKKFKGVDFPEQYYVQCVHYMMVTGADRWYLSVLVFGGGFFTYVLERDQAEIDALAEAERQFWTLVDSKVAPGIDGSEATTEALKQLYPNSTDGDTVNLFGRETTLDTLLRLKSQKKELEGEIAQLENEVKSDLMEAEGGCCPGFSVTWRSQTRRTFDVKSFAVAVPHIDLEPFYKTQTSRSFLVKRKEIM